MANNIERLNYYEREYLRSFDFIAEQNYHMEMRRRLNLALHLWGIVEGLDVKQSEPTPGLPPQFYISPGMAIDAYGREIVLFAPYTLGEEDFTKNNNRVDQEKSYSLWIAYDRSQTTPPSSGYRVCDIGDQYTRWHESFKIIIRDANYKNTTTEPTSVSSLSDDPAVEWLVRLGTITTKIIDGVLTVEQARPEQRVYIGVRTQRLIAPVASLVSTGVPPPADAALPITVEADLQEKKNLIVGDTFDVDGTKVLPLPADPPNFPGPIGNIKTANVFVRDNLYLNVPPNWVGLREYIQRLIPDIRTGTKELAITPGADPSTNTELITITSTLPAVKLPPSMVAFVAQVDRLTATQYMTWLMNINPNSPFVFDVVVGVPIQKTANTFDFPITWTIGPTADPNTATAMLNVVAVTISYVAIFYPL